MTTFKFGHFAAFFARREFLAFSRNFGFFCGLFKFGLARLSAIKCFLCARQTLRHQTSARAQKPFSRAKSCALNLISLKIHAFKQIYEFWRLKSVNFLCNLGKFANFCLNSSLRGDKVAEAIHYARSAFKSPLPCGGGWGWVFCGENSTNANFIPRILATAAFGAH